jgi:hypothetical protein
MDNKKNQQQQQQQTQQQEQQDKEQCNKLAYLFFECMKNPTTTATKDKNKCKREFVTYSLIC